MGVVKINETLYYSENVMLNPPWRMKHLSLREYDALRSQIALSTPLPPNHGGRMEMWGYPPLPSPKGISPFGIPIFVLHGVDGKTSMMDSF